MTAAGRIESYIHSDGATDNKAGAMVRVLCQTDYAAKTQPFIDFCKKVAKMTCGFDVVSWPALVEAFPTIEKDREEISEKIGEEIKVVHVFTMKL